MNLVKTTFLSNITRDSYRVKSVPEVIKQKQSL